VVGRASTILSHLKEGHNYYQINKLRTPFNVNSIAQAAATAALGDTAYLHRTLLHNQTEWLRVTAKLQKLGCQVAKSYANFVFFRTKKDSIELSEHLLRKGIIVKPWQTMGYENFLRVTIGSKEDNDLLLKNLVSLLA
jgi:histidinol-phosphate aminotransferase